jgi:hypothetical protein
MSVSTMHKYLSPFALGLFALLGPAHSIPIELQQVEHTNRAKALDIRSDSDSCATNQPSVYICQN